MSEFCKNKRSLILALAAFFLAITILAGSVAYLAADVDQPEQGERVPAGEDVEAGGEDGGEDFPEPEGDDGPEPDPQPETVHYNKPSEMRGVFLTPGKDFITGADTSETVIRAEIDKALGNAKSLTMNTIIIDTTYGDSVIYSTATAPEVTDQFDIMAYIVEKAREQGFYTYAIFDASFYSNTQSGVSKLAIGGGSVSALAANVREFAEKYQVDGILIDGYLNTEDEQSYSLYAALGGAIGYNNYMRQTPEAVVKTVSKTIRQYAKGTQVGLLADAVWENADNNEEGSATKASFTALSDGNADTKAFVEDGLVDFVAVMAYTSLTNTAVPFKEVVSWWAEVARDAGVPMYAVHASDKLCTSEAGWQAQDQLVRQIIESEDITGLYGSVFNSLSRLVEDPQGASTTLVKYYNEEVEAEHILTELEVTRPEATTYTTSEPVVTFTGASDPNAEVTINGEVIPTDASGYFTVTKDLSGGANTFTITHKAKTVTYNITREIEVLKDISPMGSIAAEGGMAITITAMAYQDATVSASINGSTVQLTVDEDAQLEDEYRDSSYKKFVGSYTTPAATESEQGLGNIVVYASWQGQEKSLQGASVKVNKKAKIEDGVPIVVTAAQAMTYPPNTLDNVPSAQYYPLPQGAMDYAVGDEIIYKKGSDTYTYFVLASDLRINTDDISTSSDYASGNAISAMNVTSENGYTYMTLKTAQKTSYTFSYTGESVGIQFHYTTATPESMSLDSNPLFSKATWSDNKLTLSMIKSGCFMGYKAYYDENGNLVFRFNNPPASISGARIVVDPGHGGSDSGALGFLADYPEKVVNKAIAELLADELEARGATVLLLNTSSGMSLQERVRQAENFNAHLFISVHNNSSYSSSATGTEAYYFYPYGKALASSASSNVSNQLGITNRGAKQSYYIVTLSAQVPSVLVECGFLSNKTEYEKLIKAKNQKKIATGIADAVATAIKSANTGSSASGTQGNGDAAGAQAPADGTTNNNDDVEKIVLSKDSLTLKVGGTTTLTAKVYPDDDVVTWSSGNTSVASVSATGKVTAIAEGTATLTAKSGDLTATCTVKVVAEDADGEDDVSVHGGEAEIIELDTTAETLEVGKTCTIGYEVYGDPTAKVVWESSDDDIATVNSSGKVTALKAGTCTIIASVGNVEATCKITVTGDGNSGTDTQAGAISLNKASYIYFEEDYIDMYVGTTRQLVIKSDKGTIKNSDLKWKSSDEKIATVSSSGVVTAKKRAGDVVITAYTSNEEFYETCEIYVTDKKVSVTGITLNRSTLNVYRGKTSTELKATLTPSNATNSDLVWKSSNEKVAKVDSNGAITGVNRGTATITVRAKDGNVSAKCEVTVLKDDIEVEYIDLESDTLELDVDEEYQLDVWLEPDEASGLELVWSSSNTAVVTVDSKGYLVAKKRGTATITVKVKDQPDVTATCKITVYD